jgi:diaminopimelate decarboxylase
MNHFTYRGGEFCCEDVRLSEIARAVGTPVYVYSTATLEHHFAVFKAVLAPRDVLIAFAVKANANIGVLATLARRGAGADVVSQGEIERAMVAGVPADRIVFSGVGKTQAELAFALDADLHQINVESAAELQTLSNIAHAKNKRPAIALRVNPDVGAGAHDKISTGGGEAKFGVALETAAELYARAAADPHLMPRGLAVHIGSQIRDLAPLERAFRSLRALTEELRRAGLAVDRLDLGGGLGVPYFNEPAPPSPHDYAAMISATIGDLSADLICEPGRMIAANAGVLVARVLRVQMRARPVLVLDAGMNDLIRPAIYGAFHEIKPLAQPIGEATETYDVVGPICETGDTFARARALPPLAGEDYVAFMTAGAYGATMSSTYNGRPLVPEVLVRGGAFELVRRRWSIADQLALEQVPSWLKTPPAQGN